MRGRIWTRGEEMAVLALRLYNEASLAEIASYIGRTRGSINSHLRVHSFNGMGWRARARAFLGIEESFRPPEPYVECLPRDVKVGGNRPLAKVQSLRVVP